MENLRAFEVVYIPYTDKKPARIKIVDLRNNKKIIIDYNDEDVSNTAENFLKSKGIEIMGCSVNRKGYILTSKNFITMIK